MIIVCHLPHGLIGHHSVIIIVMIHDLGREDDAHVAEVDVDCAEVFAVAWAARQDRDLWQVLQ